MLPPTRPWTAPRRKRRWPPHQWCGTHRHGAGLCALEHSLGAYLNRLCLCRHRHHALGALMICTTRKTPMAAANWRAKLGIRAAAAARMPFCAPLGCFPPMVRILSKPCCACRTAATRSAWLMTRSAALPPRAQLPRPACPSPAAARGATKTGTYHFSGAPDVSWCDFARAIFAQAGAATRVQAISTSAYPTPAARPLNSAALTAAQPPPFLACRAQIGAQG